MIGHRTVGITNRGWLLGAIAAAAGLCPACASSHRTKVLEARVAQLEAQVEQLRLEQEELAGGPAEPGAYGGDDEQWADAQAEGEGDFDGAAGARGAARQVMVGEAWDEVCNGPASVPLEIAGSRYFVDVTLRGPKASGRFRFQVDTGGSTPGLTLLASTARLLGFDPKQGAAELPGTIGIGDREIDLPPGAGWALIDDLGPAAKQASPSSFATRRDFSVGQIGAGFLSRFLVCIDPAAGRLGLMDPAELEVEAADQRAIPLELRPLGENQALYPIVHLSVPGAHGASNSYAMLLDTGAASSMLLAPELAALAKQNPSWPHAKGAAGDADMLGGQWPETMLRVPEAKIAWAVREQPSEELARAPGAPGAHKGPQAAMTAGEALLVDRSKDSFSQLFGKAPGGAVVQGALGNDVLNRFRMLIDYQGERLWLLRTERAPELSAVPTRIGLALSFGSDGCPVVRQITDSNDRSAKDKVKIGDALVGIDGAGVCEAWHHQISAALAGQPGQHHELTLRRANKLVTADVAVVDLLPAAGSAPPAPARAGDKLFGNAPPSTVLMQEPPAAAVAPGSPPAKAEPSKTPPAQAAPSKTPPAKAAPSKTPPAKAEPSKAAPPKPSDEAYP